MRWLHLNVVEGFLGPKATSCNLRAYIRYTRVVNGTPETPENGPESDVSQRKAHGYHLWSDPRKFEIPESFEGSCKIDFEVHANNVLRDDELLANGCISEAFVSQLINDNPGYVKEFDIALAPTKEFAYSNDDGGAQETYNYRVRVRVLITPAGYEPTEEHKSQLMAPSQHFDPNEEKEGDENNEIGLIDAAQAVQSELARWPIFRALKLIIFALIALGTGIMTIIALVEEVSKQTDPAWHISNPEEGKRCVRMFDAAKKVEKDGLASTIYYNYNLQNASVAFCTNKTRDEIETKFGSYAKFDAALDALGPDCALDGSFRADLLANCEPYPACATFLAASPAPFGVMLNYEIEAPSNQTVFNAKCASVVTSLDALTTINWPTCGESNLFVYRHVRSAIIYLLFIFSFVFCWVRLILEFVGVYIYHTGGCADIGPARSEGYLFRIAFRGLAGPLYYLFLMIKTRSTHLPIVNDPPLPLEVLFLICEAVPNLALPVYAIAGCSSDNTSGLMLLLLIFGIFKVVVIVIGKIVGLVLKATAKEEKVRPEEILEVKPAM